jgi:hypothetical protein
MQKKYSLPTFQLIDNYVKGFRIQGSLLRPSGFAGQAGFSSAAGQKTTGLIEKETLKKRISNIE